MLLEHFFRSFPLPKSIENKMATPLGISVFWRNKEIVSQCEGQNPEPVTFKNLVVHFDQGKIEELLSEGGPVFHTRKHRKVSMAKISEKKLALVGK